jgi:hypothetical protein
VRATSTPDPALSEQAMMMATLFGSMLAQSNIPSVVPRSQAPVVSQNPEVELQQFLDSFEWIKGINAHSSKDNLLASAISPALLTHMLPAQVMELTGLRESHTIALQLFGKEWSEGRH